MTKVALPMSSSKVTAESNVQAAALTHAEQPENPMVPERPADIADAAKGWPGSAGRDIGGAGIGRGKTSEMATAMRRPVRGSSRTTRSECSADDAAMIRPEAVLLEENGLGVFVVVGSGGSGRVRQGIGVIARTGSYSGEFWKML